MKLIQRSKPLNKTSAALITLSTHLPTLLPALLLTLCATITLSTTSAWGMGKALPSRTGNFCKDEAHEFIEKRFKGEVKVTDIKILGSHEQWWMYVYVDKCEGYFMMDFLCKKGDCESVQHGKRTRFISRVTAQDSCKYLLPRDEYP